MITDDPQKDAVYVEKVIGRHRHLLESETCTSVLYECSLEEKGIRKTAVNSTFNGLQLDREILQLIYSDNPKRFLGLD